MSHFTIRRMQLTHFLVRWKIRFVEKRQGRGSDFRLIHFINTTMPKYIPVQCSIYHCFWPRLSFLLCLSLILRSNGRIRTSPGQSPKRCQQPFKCKMWKTEQGHHSPESAFNFWGVTVWRIVAEWRKRRTYDNSRPGGRERFTCYLSGQRHSEPPDVLFVCHPS